MQFQIDLYFDEAAMDAHELATRYRLLQEDYLCVVHF